MERAMDKTRELEVQKKKEFAGKGESTTPAKYFLPNTDIYETADALTIVMEIPGVDKKDLSASVENDILRVEGRIDFTKYEGLEPVYAEYNVGHYVRTFALSRKIAQDGISADLRDGVLALTLRKVKEAQPRQIPIG
jgi:HSP20 family molecular chaperone IbpA